VNALLEALRFMTVLPIPGQPATDERSITAAIPWFPAAGLLIGLLLLPVGGLAGWLWNDLVRAVLLVVVWGSITGGLHLDGLSDTFDAVLSWRPRERKLEIMKDSRVGAMGVLALVAVLLLKVAWLYAAGDSWWLVVLLAPVWGRWADMYGIFWFPAARAGGLGRTFHAQVQQRGFVLSTLGVLLLTTLLGQWHGVLAAALVWGSTHLLARWWTYDLGGLTGDTYGALCEIGEVVALAALTALR
jgi:adenosylcobinamide-GDP ribazoletransferase